MKHQTAVNFFYHHAGFSVGMGETNKHGHWRSARRLAEAEQWAKENDLLFQWEYDQGGCIGCECGSPDCACSSGAKHKVLCCIARYATGEVVASLGSICGADRNYRRVIEAELALEAMPVEVSV